MDSSLEKFTISLHEHKHEQITPLAYFGQREHIVQDLFKLIPTRKYKTFYDPFCGSGSITFAAMHKEIAQEYVMNDSYSILAHLWHTIKNNKESICLAYILKYHELYESYDDKRDEIYKATLDEFNNESDHTKAAALYLFLNNNAKNNMPVFAGNTLNTTFNHNDEPLSFIIQRIRESSALLNQHQVHIKSGDFMACLHDVTKEDIVILDPPYPTLSSDVYFNLSEPDQLFKDLTSAITILNEKKVPFVISYGAGDLPECYQFDEQELQVVHLIRLTNSPVFGPYLEHVYIPKTSSSIMPTLPSYIIPYVSYNDAKEKLIGSQKYS